MNKNDSTFGDFLLFAVLGGCVAVLVMLVLDLTFHPPTQGQAGHRAEIKAQMDEIAKRSAKEATLYPSLPPELVTPSPFLRLDAWPYQRHGFVAPYDIYIMPDDMSGRISSRARIYKTYDVSHPIKLVKDGGNKLTISYDLSDKIEIVAQDRHESYFDDTTDYYPIVAVHTHKSPIVISKSDSESGLTD